VSVVARTPEFSNGVMRTVFADWQVSPIIRWQSGDRSTVTTGVDNALTGMGNQRAVQIVDNPYGSGAPDTYLNRAAFTTPATGTYSSLKPFTIVNPSRLTNDLALTRNLRLAGSRGIQLRWEIFNVLNHTNFNAPTASLNSGNFGKITTAQDPRIMQFALKFDF